MVRRTRIDHALKEHIPEQRLRDPRKAGRPTLRPVAEGDDNDPSARRREDWFDRTFEQVRCFLDDMFR